MAEIQKQPLSVFLITLLRILLNLKIFDLKTLGYLTIRVKGFDGKGVTQCFIYNNFNHTSDNCPITSGCPKCGEPHLTRHCHIKQRDMTKSSASTARFMDTWEPATLRALLLTKTKVLPLTYSRA
ncbi:hypothetical protein TNCV_497541 [Trichonephila clavipes]|nr:hypothetical protein TNCV_497541 [Trichonephila clavipes]